MDFRLVVGNRTAIKYIPKGQFIELNGLRVITVLNIGWELIAHNRILIFLHK
jgi:hypothetical protein